MSRIPKCRKCGSTDVSATSSTQYRSMDGRLRQVADAVCGRCGHTWWSVSPAIRKLARDADKARKLAASSSH
jgi:hypothetical protein